jgi:hypothetical protein
VRIKCITARRIGFGSADAECGAACAEEKQFGSFLDNLEAERLRVEALRAFQVCRAQRNVVRPVVLMSMLIFISLSVA